MPDISVKVAAMQTGIEASYPAYIPRDFSLNDVSSEEGKISISFKGPDRAAFVLSEEKSSWIALPYYAITSSQLGIPITLPLMSRALLYIFLGLMQHGSTVACSTKSTLPVVV